MIKNSADFLNITPAEKLSEWFSIINSTLEDGVDIYYIGDTETTGFKPDGNKSNKDLKDRLLEIAFLCYTRSQDGTFSELKDSDGCHIHFHEYINPFAEPDADLKKYRSIEYIPTETIEVHGITKEFISGESGLTDSQGQETDFKLKKQAPTFQQIKPILESYFATKNKSTKLGSRYFVAHNAIFDAGFISSEWHRVESFYEDHLQPAKFESYITTIDTLSLIKDMYSSTKELTAAFVTKENYDSGTKINHKLDFLKTFYGHDNIMRDVHGAMIDSYILAEVFFDMLKDQAYQNLPQVKQFSNTNYEAPELNSNGVILL